jgi:hypothetical protein ORF034
MEFIQSAGNLTFTSQAQGLDKSVNTEKIQRSTARYYKLMGDLGFPFIPYRSLDNPNGYPVRLMQAQSFQFDYYYRIHVRPSEIDVGNLTSAQTIRVEIWNAWFNNKTLKTIRGLDAPGITTNGATFPKTYYPLESSFFELVVTQDGPPDIDGRFEFDWDDPIGSTDLRVTGSRVVLIPWCMEAPMKETLEWKTEILESVDGYEQRIRLRKFPRCSLEAQYPLPYRELQLCENLIYGWHTKPFGVPLWSEAQFCGDLARGTMRVPISGAGTQLQAGQNCLIWNSNRRYVTMGIRQILADTVVLDKPLPANIPHAYLSPLMGGRAANASLTRATDGYKGQLQANWNLTRVAAWQAPVPEQFLGDDIYFEKGIIGTSATLLDSTVSSKEVKIDYEVSEPEYFYPNENAHVRRSYNFLTQGLLPLWNIRMFLYRRCGKLRPFWLPTFENNLSLKQEGQLLSTITVKDEGYRQFANKRKHIAIKFMDNHYECYTVNSISQGYGGLVNLMLDRAINKDATTVREISYLGYYRLDSDSVTIEWNTNRVANVQIPILEIKP